MYEIKLTVEIPGLPEAFSALIGALNKTGSKQTEDANSPISTTPAVVNIDPPFFNSATPPAQSSPEIAVVKQAAPMMAGAKNYTLDDLSRAGAALIDQDKMPQLLDLLKKFNVQAVTQLNPSVYPAFVEELKALGAQL